jgi:hypothetical protein
LFRPLRHARGRWPPDRRRRHRGDHGGRMAVLSMVSALPIPVDVLVATTAVMPTTCGRPRGSG